MSSGRLPALNLGPTRTPQGTPTPRGHPYQRQTSTSLSGRGAAQPVGHGHTTAVLGQGLMPLSGNGVVGAPGFQGGGPGESAQRGGGVVPGDTPGHVGGQGSSTGPSPGWISPTLRDSDALEGQLFPYTPPGGSSATPGLSPSATSLAPGAIEMLCRDLDIAEDRRLVFEFYNMDVDAKLTVLFANNRALRFSNIKANRSLRQIHAYMVKIEELTAAAWEPSKPQMMILRGLVRHYLVKPVSSYNQVVPLTKSYIRDHAAALRLGLYNQDQTVRTSINTIVCDLTTQMKSALRKATFRSLENRVPLTSFCRRALDNYHLPAVPLDPPLAVLGTFALFRKVAGPLLKPRGKVNKGDTGFWPAVESELDKLYAAFPTAQDRVNDPEWQEWARNMVADDEARYPIDGRSTVHTTREELDLALGMDANFDDWDIVNPSEAIDGNGMQADQLDGDVEIGQLGDLAQTATVTV